MWLGLIVREGGGELTVSVGLCEQRLGLRRERLYGVRACSKTGGRLLEANERDERLRQLGGVATLV